MRPAKLTPMSGTMRQLVNNMVVGVSKGFEKKLSLVGVGLQGPGCGCKVELGGGLFPPGRISRCQPVLRWLRRLLRRL